MPAPVGGDNARWTLSAPRRLRDLPPVTRAVAAYIVLASVAISLPGPVGKTLHRLLCFMPSRTVNMLHVWNPVTALFVERSAPLALVHAFLLMVLGKWLEPLLGATQLVIYMFGVCTATGYSVFVVYIVAYAISHNTRYLFVEFCGTLPLFYLFIVALKQATPERGMYGVKACHLPSILVLLGGVLYAAQLVPLYAFLGPLFATYYSWLYLRFLQRKETGRGDSSEDFAFHTFFPSAMSVPVSFAANVVYAVAAYVLGSAAGRTRMGGGGLAAAGGGGAFVSSSARNGPLDLIGDVESGLERPAKVSVPDADRRRSIALRALNERLQGSDDAADPNGEPAPPADTNGSEHGAAGGEGGTAHDSKDAQSGTADGAGGAYTSVSVSAQQ